MPFVCSQILQSDICYGLFLTHWPSSLLRKEKRRDKEEYVSFLSPRLSSLVNAQDGLGHFFPSLFHRKVMPTNHPAILQQSSGTLLKITHSSLLWILIGRTMPSGWSSACTSLYSISLSFKSRLKLEAFSVALSGASCIESGDGWKHFTECTLHHWLPVPLLQKCTVGRSRPEVWLLHLLRHRIWQRHVCD